ncbi:MAG: PfkB family carbohydrate kinase [Planctomycetia bacterium]|nr:PfkB family carbohydrate kinase [Planctomycetia bacterium]
MSLLITGSAAYDTIATPEARRDRVLGGSGVYSSYAASFFTEPHLVSVVGDDWNGEDSLFLKKHGINLDGLEIRSGAKTLYWSGRYFENMNERETLEIELNVMGVEYDPVVPKPASEIPYVFLANGGPGIHLALLNKMSVKPKLVIADTMDFYINNDRANLDALLRRIDGLILNDSEVKLLTGETNLIRAGKRILDQGPRMVIIKKGEHGALYLTQDGIFMIPAYPTDRLVDPTGAGDTFAGALSGYLAASDDLTEESIRKGLAYATVVASFCVEGFSLERLANLTRDNIEERYREFRNMVAF